MKKQVTENTFAQVKRFYTPNVFRYRQAEYEMRTASVRAAQAERETTLRVMEAYRRLSTARANYQALLRAVELAREHLNLAEGRYKGGVATLAEVQDASLTLRQVRLQALESLHLYRVTAAQLEVGLFLDGEQAH